MSNSNYRDTILKKITAYSQKAGQLGRKARQLVFGFRLRSTAHTDRLAFPVKLLHDHRLLQRWRAYRQSGGHHSSIARYALNKARGSRN